VDAFAMVQAFLPGVELSGEQLAQVRALNREYYQRLYTLRHPDVAEGAASDGSAPVPDESRIAQLEAALASNVREMLTDTQRAEFDRRRGLNRGSG
jgi:hypothetical protein